jgi:chemotaxis protein MotB
MSAAKSIIIKKKGSHGGHHGGAWKVAYADFVTAMMALFIVLWLLNSSQKIQKAVGGYFRDPSGTADRAGSDMNGVGENFVLTKDNMDEIKEQLEKNNPRSPRFRKAQEQHRHDRHQRGPSHRADRIRQRHFLRQRQFEN